ncbi:MAG: HK97 family phage prohead protease [Kouleothrix sp.]|nr:HK97 family phage prohead protease [Kouleothrix sp.]
MTDTSGTKALLAAQKQQQAQQAAAQRQQQAAQRAAAQSARQSAQATRQTLLDAQRQQRQAAADQRRARLDAARATRDADMAERRKGSDARAAERFKEWQDKQKTTGKATSAKSSTKTSGGTTASDSPSTPSATTKPAPSSTTRHEKPKKKHHKRQHAQERAGAVLRSQLAIPSTKTLAEVTKRATGPIEPYRGWVAITKRDDEQRIVEGVAAAETPDTQGGMYDGQIYAGDIVAMSAIADALPDYLKWANLREMHQPSAVGTVLAAEIVDGALHIVAKIVDDDAWNKVKQGVYKGFSIGGKCLAAAIVKSGAVAFRKITRLILSEISLVDRPANPEACIALWKGYDMDSAKEPAQTEAGEITKAATGDPMKAVAMLQALRDAAELAGQVGQARGYSIAIEAALEAAGVAQEQDADEADETADDEAQEFDDAEQDAGGDVTQGEDITPNDSGATLFSMAQRIGDIAKSGRALSGANMGHLKNMHDMIVKMGGGTFCAPQGAASQAPGQPAPGQPAPGQPAPGQPAPGQPAPALKASMPADPASGAGLQKSIDAATAPLQETIADLTKRLAALESQPATGGPALRAVDKALQTGQGEQPIAKRAPVARDLTELRRLSIVEPSPMLRADYARQLAELENQK